MSSYCDLSQIKTQNTIISTLARYFTIDEVEQIDFNTIYGYKRDLSESPATIYTTRFNNKILEVSEIYIIDIYPATIYTIIRVIVDNDIIQFDCKYSDKLINYLNIMRYKLINYLRYKNPDDEIINKTTIFNNYATIISKELSMKELYELYYVATYLNNTCKEVLKIKGYEFDFNLDNNRKFSLSTNIDILILNISDKVIYLDKNKLGITHISIILEKAITYKN